MTIYGWLQWWWCLSVQDLSLDYRRFFYYYLWKFIHSFIYFLNLRMDDKVAFFHYFLNLIVVWMLWKTKIIQSILFFIFWIWFFPLPNLSLYISFFLSIFRSIVGLIWNFSFFVVVVVAIVNRIGAIRSIYDPSIQKSSIRIRRIW